MNCLLQCSHAALLAIRIKSSHWALVALKGKRMQKSEPPHAIITTCHCATHPAQHAFIASPYASPPATCTFFISPLPPSDVSAVNSCIARVEERREWGLCMAGVRPAMRRAMHGTKVGVAQVCATGGSRFLLQGFSVQI